MSNSSSIGAVFRCLPTLLPSHWLRRRGVLGPPQVFLSLMFMSVLGTKGYERTIDEMRNQLGRQLGWDTPDLMPSGSALCQARRKLDAARCYHVMSEVYKLCRTAREHASVGYAGLRLLAIDGTKLILPAYRKFIQHFGCPTRGAGKQQQGPQASLTVLWDVGANQPVNWRLGPYRLHERIQGLELLESLGSGDLLIADRGFPSRRMLQEIQLRGAHFLMRIRCDHAGSLREVADFSVSTSRDAIVSLFSRDKLKTPFPVRLIRHDFPDGSVTVLITSLCDPLQHPAEELIKLYSQRWRVETAFRELKLWHGLERFHARHVDGIAQEVCALMVFQLLASELQARAEQHHGITHTEPPAGSDSDPNKLQQLPIRFNRRIIGDCAVNLLHAGTKGDADFEKEFEYCMFRLWRYRQKPRPGRSFPREKKSAPRGFRIRGTKGKGRP